METITQYIDNIARALEAVEQGEILKMLDLLESSYKKGLSVFIAGNGGSAANASHFAQDLTKGAVPDIERSSFRVLSLADNVSFITAISNDIGYERIFDLQLRQFARKGDVLIAISGSGNSPNIIRAANYGRENGLTVIGFTGFDGGKLMPLSDIRVHVPINNMCMIEAAHATIMHMATDFLRERLTRLKCSI